MAEAANLKINGPDVGVSSCDYFHTLCQQSFPGPLVSGNVGSKDLNKWIDDRIASYSVPSTEYRKSEALRMLFCLLKIACQFYGKLRSGFGADLGSKENDCPESALAKLFASAKRNGSQFSAVAHCLQNMPSEGQIQATANEVQMLLVSGKRMEALQCAQEGQLWGPALVIAAMLGEKFYGETVKQMALHQLVAGSPLRTLCLLLAGQPAEVFSNPPTNNPPSGVNVTQPVQIGPAGMLDGWEENLAIITANRTTGDELVITHLGDCLWKERGEVTAAHICYLVAEANIESYSESARLCLVGADHLKCPRTYASPEAIQRTELYEYAKVLGNSQFIVPPFQPYKLIYASMLAEVGKLSDSLKYCQAALRSLKAGRSSEVDAWRHMISALEERIKIHQQGGYATNLAPTKLVGKLLNFFDNTAHRVVGGLPPPIPSQSNSNGRHNEPDNQSRGPRVYTSQSTMAMSSLMSSTSTEGNSRKLMHNRSVSEPDIGRTPRKDESSKESNSSEQHDAASTSGGSSRFGRFGSQIFQKTVGLVLRSRSDRQAKLGEKNKFYYDEKLKRWVEEGAEPPAEEPALAPPPTTAAFMDGMPDHAKKVESVNGIIHANGESEFKATNAIEKFSGTPPIPPGSNQFSARGRMGVRARYVDTFNKGGGTQANSFQLPSPLIPAVKPAIGNAKFFIPSPATGGLETKNIENTQGLVADEDASTSDRSHSFSPPQMGPPSPAMHRHPSAESLPNIGTPGTVNGNGSLPPHSRRTLSWSGDLGDPLNPLSPGETIPLGEALGMSPSTYMPSNSSAMSSSYSTTLADDLQEVQL
uniref:Protein transport protein sec16 n=1 Tax=Opuntia streptacantha TaxID=393608 RepID=A0A7C9EVL2_OPUST